MVTFLSALNPVRLALTLLVVSRPRPVQNVVAFWLGCLAGSIPGVVVPLTLVHVTGMSGSVPKGGEANSTVQHIQVGAGVFALTIAAVMAVRSLKRRRERARLAASGDTSTLVSDSNAIERLLGRGSDDPTQGESVLRRLILRAQSAWEDGSLWIAFVIGLVCGGPQPDVSLFVVAIIVASGAAIGTQIAAAAVFVVGTMGIIEIILVSYLIAPQKTLAVLRRIHDWSSAHRQQILVAIFTVIGVALLANGLGVV